MRDDWSSREEGQEPEFSENPESDWSRVPAGDEFWDDDEEFVFDSVSEIALLVSKLGTETARDQVEFLGGYERGSSELAEIMQQLRAMRDAGKLSPDAHFFIVTEIMEPMEFHGADGDSEARALLKQVQVLWREYCASRAPDDDED